MIFSETLDTCQFKISTDVHFSSPTTLIFPFASGQSILMLPGLYNYWFTYLVEINVNSLTCPVMLELLKLFE